MPKTYTAAGSATAGDVYTASAHNVIVTDVNNFIVPPCARVTVSATEALTSNTALSWDVESYDTDGIWTSGTPKRLTVQTDGIYLFVLNWISQVTVSTCNSHELAITLNGGAYAMERVTTAVAANEYIIHSISVVISLVAGTYAEAVLSFNGGTHTALNDARNNFSCHWLGRTA